MSADIRNKELRGISWGVLVAVIGGGITLGVQFTELKRDIKDALKITEQVNQNTEGLKKIRTDVNEIHETQAVQGRDIEYLKETIKTKRR